jgi:hypothetical protein
LRDDVRVTFSDDFVRIGYSLWEVALPAAWVAERPDMKSFLLGRSVEDLTAGDPEITAVLELLDAQGCLEREPLVSQLSLADLRDRFDRIRNNWYAQYYAHPLWNRLRQGTASLNELVAYLVHNYHISRAAGSVAARMATRGIEPWRKFFADDARIEYWHCDAYYFVQSAVLGFSRQSIKEYVPLPSSTAFEQHALQMAGRNSIAHLLIAYFQESSVMFSGDTGTFYAEVERAYNLRGFFRPWQNHIGIDIEEKHAAGLAALFLPETIIDASVANEAMAMAFAGYYFLLSALDEIMAEDRPDNRVVLRNPVPNDAGAVVALIDKQVDANTPDKAGEAARRDLRNLAGMLASSALQALAAARSHDEIMVAGRFRDSLLLFEAGERHPKSPWTLALANFIAEAAVRPLEWAALLVFLLRRFEQAGLSFGINSREHIARISAVPAVIPNLATELFRLDELVKCWLQRSAVTFPENL